MGKNALKIIMEDIKFIEKKNHGKKYMNHGKKYMKKGSENMSNDYYEAKEDARSDFLAENCENLEENFDFILDLLLILNFDVTTLRKD